VAGAEDRIPPQNSMLSYKATKSYWAFGASVWDANTPKPMGIRVSRGSGSDLLKSGSLSPERPSSPGYRASNSGGSQRALPG